MRKIMISKACDQQRTRQLFPIVQLAYLISEQYRSC